MKSTTILPLALALSLALFATACDREADDAVVVDPAVTAEPAIVEPAPVTTTPEATPLDSGMDFTTMDVDADGGVTREELNDTEMLYLHFDVADTDGDGRLSSEEVDAHRASMAEAG
ncbi:MAG: hypothetical protein M3Q42_04880 [Pseudomonadota bacterium]|nr:hypothetical protein [Pseudomonadota bacterium]